MSGQLVLRGAAHRFRLSFDYTNGFHDTANAIATSVSTHALSPTAAVVMSAFFNLVGPLISTRVADTIVGLVTIHISLLAILAGLIGATSWNLLTWYFGLPSSSSHALIGGVIGSAMISAGFAGVKMEHRGENRRLAGHLTHPGTHHRLPADARDLLGVPASQAAAIEQGFRSL